MAIQTLEGFIQAFGYEPDGFPALREFCKTVDAGEMPDPEFLQTCSKAFKRILSEEILQDGLMFFADEMNLKKQPGRKFRTSSDADAELALVMEVLLAVRDDGLNPAKAKKEIAKKRRKSLRSIQRYYKDHVSDAMWFLENFNI